MQTLVLFVPLLAIALTGCARVEETTPDNQANSVSIGAGSGKELCFESKKDDEVVFRFEADRPIEFNLHYHIDDQVYYPVVEHATAAEKGQYLVPKDDTYCLMWTNKNDVAVELSASVEGVENITWY